MVPSVKANKAEMCWRPCDEKSIIESSTEDKSASSSSPIDDTLLPTTVSDGLLHNSTFLLARMYVQKMQVDLLGDIDYHLSSASASVESLKCLVGFVHGEFTVDDNVFVLEC